ncbi:hypothetical protein [Thalassotalea sp. PLHSN55]|uniref:hypothetical protein n=1 Tax=Thalassotalea sp. PLHSN55 TaxID=3435888 RepID=UPI003F844566
MSYLKNVLVAIDQLGNALCGGNPDVTISARTGYFANVGDTSIRMWWQLMERIINFAFSPFDGPNHCLDAYHADNESHHNEGSDFLRALLGFIIIVTCLFIAILSRVWVVFLPSSGYKAQQ